MKHSVTIAGLLVGSWFAATAVSAASVMDLGPIVPNGTVTSGEIVVQKNPGSETDTFLFDFTQSVNGILSVEFDPNTTNNLPLAKIGTVSLLQWNNLSSTFAQIASIQASFSDSPGVINDKYVASFTGVFAPGSRVNTSDYELLVDATAPGSQNTQFSLRLTAGPAVAPIPEPHEWAMMLAGLGVVGWVARRRNAASRV